MQVSGAAPTPGLSIGVVFGASATARALNLDRHWRNMRTVASHRPLAYKAYAAGDYAVNGVRPPANRYF